MRPVPSAWASQQFQEYFKRYFTVPQIEQSGAEIAAIAGAISVAKI